MTAMKIHLRRATRQLLLSSLLISATLLILACSQQVETARKTENRTNEAAAIRALQTIFRMQTQYSVTHSGDYGTFDQLVKDGSLDQRFAGTSPALEGYVFKMVLVPQAGAQAAEFSVNADPQQTEGAPATSARHLYLDSSSNVIHFNNNRPATASDPPLQ
jgi:hypothetical protein